MNMTGVYKDNTQEQALRIQEAILGLQNALLDVTGIKDGAIQIGLHPSDYARLADTIHRSGLVPMKERQPGLSSIAGVKIAPVPIPAD